MFLFHRARLAVTHTVRCFLANVGIFRLFLFTGVTESHDGVCRSKVDNITSSNRVGRGVSDYATEEGLCVMYYVYYRVTILL